MHQDPNFKEKHFHAIKAIVGDVETLRRDEEPNVLVPYRRCRVIVENGGIWEATVDAFAGGREDALIQLWETKPSLFTKIEFNTVEVPK